MDAFLLLLWFVQSMTYVVLQIGDHVVDVGPHSGETRQRASSSPSRLPPSPPGGPSLPDASGNSSGQHQPEH